MSTLLTHFYTCDAYYRALSSHSEMISLGGYDMSVLFRAIVTLVELCVRDIARLWKDKPPSPRRQWC